LQKRDNIRMAVHVMKRREKEESMKMKFDIRSLVCGALVGAAVILLTGAAGQGEKGWEYTNHFSGTGNQAPIETLNKLGEQGWELCAPLATHDGTHGYLFKRPAPRRVRD
jgi:hypothetical protein